ncbi:hypothetical protein HDA40_002163 [Hamadaea flava]|uniref:TrbL/VirB6 plasmid conjugal transfer protein n=1 Tax=Hamadaea flava TaxID=1742688 RepID=A0ABV8LN52_9ACTN|nr:hypothetical protein [Hamadaea flava]MCP2323656.1 hypothetical protein [Hamadaea flava]
MGGFVTSMLDGLTSWLASAAMHTLLWISGVLDKYAFSIPNVTGLQPTQALAGRARTIVNIVFPLIIVAAGVIGMTYNSAQIQYQVKDLLPRLVVGWVGANWSIPMCDLLLRFADAFIQALTTPMPDEATSFERLKSLLALSLGADPTGEFDDPIKVGLLGTIITVLVVILAAWLVLTWIIRYALLIVLVGLSPLAMACYSLPQLEGAARLWWRTVIGCMAIPAAQATTFSTGMWILLDPAAGLPAGIKPDDASSRPITLFAVLAVMLFTAKIPTLVSRYISSSGTPKGSFFSQVAKVLVLHRMTKGFTRRVGGTRRRTDKVADTAAGTITGGARNTGSGTPAGGARPPFTEGNGRDRVTARQKALLPPPPRDL